MSRGLKYLILFGDGTQTRPIYLTIKDDENDIGQLSERIYAENKPFLESHGVSRLELALYKPIESLPISQLERARSAKLEGVDLKTIQSTFGTGQLDPNLVHLVVKVQGSAQTLKRKRSSDDDNTTRVSEGHVKLWKAYWGVSLSSEYTGRCSGMMDSPINVEVGDLLPGAPLMGPILSENPFLVRAEYIRMYEYVEACFAERKMKPPAVIITGQPGIGKTIWIEYVLRLRLGEKRPVMLRRGDHYLLFCSSGVKMVYPSSKVFYDGYDGVPWCLIDSTVASDGIPSEISGPFERGVNPIYVTSPESRRWTKLHQTRSTSIALMNPWSWEEMECALRAFSLDTEKVRQRFEEFGPIPRLCLEYNDQQMKRYEDECRRAIDEIQDMASVLDDTAHDARELTMTPAKLSHRICLLRRQELNEVSLEHDMSMTSDFIANLCAVRLQQLEDDEVLKVWKRFSKHKDATAMTGAVFEAYVHVNFRKWISINAEEMFASARGKYYASFASYEGHSQLQRSLNQSQANIERFGIAFPPLKTVVYKGGKDRLSIEPEVYYQPRKDQQVGIDSLFIHAGYLYLLQMTGGDTHEIKSDLETFLAKLDWLPPTEKWRFVFVIPFDADKFNCPKPSIEVGKLFTYRFTMGRRSDRSSVSFNAQTN